MDVKVLQTIMWHSNIAVTMEVYNHVDKVRVQNEMKNWKISCNICGIPYYWAWLFKYNFIPNERKKMKPDEI